MTSVPYAAPPRATFWQMLGPGGLISFGLALASGGLLLGRRLQNDRPTKVFEARLDHAARLLQEGKAPRIVIAGGLTGKASITEAEVGRERLLGLGIQPEMILVEDRSQHTLENLFNLRETLRGEAWSTLILVSDPLHLARAAALAKGLGLDPSCSPATACPPLRGSAGWWARAFYEAFLLHWYHTGVAYSRIIRSEAQLKRLT